MPQDAAQIRLNHAGLFSAAQQAGLEEEGRLDAFLGVEIQEPFTLSMIAAVLKGLPVTFDMVFRVA